MTEDEIWRQIEPLVQARIPSSKEKLEELFSEQCLSDELTFRAEDFIRACSELCEGIYSICEQARERVKMMKSSEFEWTIFQKAIQPEIRIMRTLALTITIILTGAPHNGWSKYGVFDRRWLDVELDKLQLQWLLSTETLAYAAPVNDSNEPASPALPPDSVAGTKPKIKETVIWEQLEPLANEKLHQFRKRRWIVDRKALVKLPLFEDSLDIQADPDYACPTLQPFLEWHIGMAGLFCEKLYDLCDKVRKVKGIAEGPEYDRAVYRHVISPQIEREQRFGKDNILGLAARVKLKPESFLEEHRVNFDRLDFYWKDRLGLATPSDGLAPAADRTEEVDTDRPVAIETPREAGTDSRSQISGELEPSVAARRAVIWNMVRGKKKRPKHIEICKKLDLDGIAMPENWRENEGIADWQHAYRQHPNRVQKMISTDIKKIRSKNS